MSIIIEDGTGASHKAKVNKLHRLTTDSTSQTRQSYHNDIGRGFSLESGLMILTSDTESGVWYLKNNGSNSLVIEKLFVVLGNSNGAGDHLVKVYVNPTGGTLISDESQATLNNLKFGDSNSIIADYYKGAQAKTITGGSVCCNIQFHAPGLYPVDVSTFVLVKGQSMAVSITPPTGNSSQSVNFAVNMYEDTIGI